MLLTNTTKLLLSCKPKKANKPTEYRRMNPYHNTTYQYDKEVLYSKDKSPTRE